MRKSLSKMTTLEELKAACEYTCYNVADILRQAQQVLTDEDYQIIVEELNSYEKSIKAGSWNRRPPTVK